MLHMFHFRMDARSWLLFLLCSFVLNVESMNENMTKTKLLPGVIRKYEGEVFFVRDYLAVTINHTHTLEIPQDLKLMLREVVKIRTDLHKINESADPNDWKLIKEIAYTNDLVKDRIVEALEWFPNFRNSTRAKRGLINVIGVGLKYLFGVLTQGDLDKLNNKIASLEDLKNRDHKIIEGLTSQAEKQRVKMNQIIDQFNEVSAHISDLTDRQNMLTELHYISIYLNNIYKEVGYLTADIRHSIDDLSLASKGIISTNVVSMKELSLVMHEAKIQYYLNPIFTTKNLAYYYTVMEVLFAPSTVILQVPMASDYTFHHFRFIPFPTFHKNETLILSSKNTDILIQDKQHYLAETTHNSFAKCRVIANLKLCPSNLLPLRNALTYKSCLKSLSFTPLNMDSLCTYTSRMLTTPELLLVDLKLFVSRTEETPVRIECGKHQEVISDRTFYIEQNCDLVDTNIKVLGIRSFSMKLKTNRSSYIHRYISSVFNHTNQTVVVRLDKEEESELYISQDTINIVIPSVSVTGSVILVLIIFLCIYCKVCKPRIFKRKTEYRREVPVSPSCMKEKSDWLDHQMRSHPRVEDTYDHAKVVKKQPRKVHHSRTKRIVKPGNFVE